MTERSQTDRHDGRNRIRIAFLASTMVVGGAENVLIDVITRLPSEGFETALYFLKEAGPLGRELLQMGYSGVERLQRHRMDPLVLLRLARRLRLFSPHILFALDHHNVLLWGGVSSLIAGVPHRVVASHSTGRMNGAKNFRGSDRLFLSACDRVVALSPSHAAYLTATEGLDPAKIEIIENGIDTERFSGAGDREAVRAQLGVSAADRVVMMVAALRPEKAHEALLEAARGIVRERGNVKFVIVGDGERRGALEAMRNDLGLGGYVNFLGVRQDIPELLQAADVVVLPSHAAVETLPLALLEAMASGVPVIASAVGSVPDLIEHGRNGLLIRPADALGLRDAICHIIDNKEESDAIAARGRATVLSRYTSERMALGYASLFERLAAA